jgi:predicted Zn-dependent peptidase
VKIRVTAIALLCALALLPSVAFAAAAVAPAVRNSQGTTIIEQQDNAAPLVHVTFVVRAGLNRQTMTQNGLAALTAETILRTPVDGTPLEDAIAAHGGGIHIAVDPSDLRFAIESTPTQASAVFDLVRRALAAPAFDPKTVSAARSALLTQIAMNQQIALQVGMDMLAGQSAPSANAALPSLGIPGALAQMGPGDVRAFYSKFYRRGGSFVSGVGRLDSLAAGTLDGLAATLPAGDSSAVAVSLPKLEGTTHQYVTHRDIAAPWLIAQYPAPSIDSKDYGPMLVLSSFMQRTLSEIAQVPGVVSNTVTSRAVGAMYQYDRTEPNLTLYVNGSIGNPNRAFATALSVASILAATKLQGSIDDFKALAAGDFVNESTSLESRAWLAVLFSQNGQSADYVSRTLTAIANTNAADLQRVARQYLGNPSIALVLPRDNALQAQQP